MPVLDGYLGKSFAVPGTTQANTLVRRIRDAPGNEAGRFLTFFIPTKPALWGVEEPGSARTGIVVRVIVSAVMRSTELTIPMLWDGTVLFKLMTSSPRYTPGKKTLQDVYRSSQCLTSSQSMQNFVVHNAKLQCKVFCHLLSKSKDVSVSGGSLPLLHFSP